MYDCDSTYGGGVTDNEVPYTDGRHGLGFIGYLAPHEISPHDSLLSKAPDDMNKSAVRAFSCPLCRRLLKRLPITDDCDNFFRILH
jgi:hypothetical protein